MTTPKKIILYTTDYHCSSILRRRQIRSVINCNRENTLIDKIVILWEGWNRWKNESEYNYLSNSKIEVVNWESRPTYLDFYNHSLEHYSNDIILISNSDIIFDITIGRLRECRFTPKTCYAITRFDPLNYNVDEKLRGPPWKTLATIQQSFDAYSFCHPLDIIPETINISVGLSECDTYLVKKLIQDNLFEVKDPALDIRIWHNEIEPIGKHKEYFNKYRYWNRKDFPLDPKAHRGVIKFGHNCGFRLGCTTDDVPNIVGTSLMEHSIKVISFSMYGDDEKYTLGAIKNAELALDIYPDWRCWFYIHEKSVPTKIINALKEYPNVRIIFKKDLIIPKIWRYLPMDCPSVGILIARDVDSLISYREKSVVDEWLASGKRFHIIRDHPHHSFRGGIMGGMVGFRRMEYWKGWDDVIAKYSPENPNSREIEPGVKKYGSRIEDYALDITILKNVVYPLASKYCDIYISANFGRIESDCHEIKIPYSSDTRFIGEYESPDGKRSQYHIDILRAALNGRKEVNQCKKIKLGTILIYTTTQDEKNAIIVEDAYRKLLPTTNIKVKKIPQISSSEIPESFIRDMMNILGGCVDEKYGTDGIMTCSSSLIPIRKYFFTEIPKRFDDDRFIAYCTENDMINSWYNIATQKIWLQIWNESDQYSSPYNEEKVIQIIKRCWECKKSPRDILAEKLDKFLNRTGRLITLDNDYTNYRTLKCNENGSSDEFVDKNIQTSNTVYLASQNRSTLKLKVAVCLQVKNEEFILNELIANYLNFGFDHIFIYDNMSNPSVEDTILPKFKDCVTINKLTQASQYCKQSETYTHCYKTYGKDYDWIFNTCGNELLAFHHHKSVKQFLSQFDQNTVGAVAFHWIFFGSTPYLKMPTQRTKLISESFLFSEDDTSDYRQFFKQMYQPKAINESIQKCCQDYYVHLKSSYKAIECNGDELHYKENFSNTASLPKNIGELLSIAGIYHYTIREDLHLNKMKENMTVCESLENINKKCTRLNTYYRDNISPKICKILNTREISSETITSRRMNITSGAENNLKEILIV